MPRRKPMTAQRLVDAAADAIWASPHVGVRRRWEAGADADEILDLAAGEGVEPDAPLRPGERRRFERLVRRRVAGEPMALLRGHVDFCGMRVAVRPGVFAPRLSSELLVEQAVDALGRRRPAVVVDVATGAGPVALAVARRRRAARVIGVDISTAAVRLARANAAALGVDNAEFRRSDVIDSLPRRIRGQVSVMTAHPPYVPRGDVRLLPREIAGYEPRTTLTDGSSDGLGMVRRLAEEAPQWLRPDGVLLLEVSPDRVRDVRGVLRDADWHRIRAAGGRGDVTRVVIASPPRG